MLTAQIISPGNISLIDVPVPVPTSNEVLIKVEVAGICGTDIHIYKGDYEATYPIIPGHEFSGEVVDVGDKVKYFKPGDRVTVDPNIPCRRCPYCKQGFFNQCENLEAVGVTRDGAFAEYVAVPEGAVFSIGEIAYDVAAMVEPLACVVWGLKRIQVTPGDLALVFGAGPMGCIVAQALLKAGAAEVVITDLVEWRLNLAKHLGITQVILGPDVYDQSRRISPEGYQIVVDATGVGEVLERAVNYAQPRGKIWVFGVVPPNKYVRFLPYDIFRKDLSIIGSFAVNQTFQGAINLVQAGSVQLKSLISHQLPLDQFEDALHLAQVDPHRMKVQISFS